MPKRHNKTGRSASERFVALPHYLLRSPAWRALSPVAAKLLVEVLALYDGSNNGYLVMSARTAAERCGCSKDTAARAFAELQKLSFLELCIEGKFRRKDRHASEWRATLHPCDRTKGEPASKKFMRWKPAEKLFHGPTTGTDGPSHRTVA
jgi:hypothetical protein